MTIIITIYVTKDTVDFIKHMCSKSRADYTFRSMSKRFLHIWLELQLTV